MASSDGETVGVVPPKDCEDGNEGVEGEEQADGGEEVGGEEPGGCEAGGRIEWVEDAEEGVNLDHLGRRCCLSSMRVWKERENLSS